MIIDVHGHVASPDLIKRYPMPPSLGDIEGMLERKAEVGIEITIVGTPVGAGTMMPIPGHSNYTQTADELKVHHDFLAGVVADHPGRIYSYAYCNPFGGDEGLADAARLVQKEGFVGLIVNSSVEGRYLDDEAAEQFWAMAAEVDAPILLHPPAEPVGAAAMHDFRLVEQVGRFCDVTMGLAAIIFSGYLQRHPNVRVIGATSGGALSLVVARLDTAYAPAHWGPPSGAADADAPPPREGGPPWARWRNKIDRPPSTFLRQIYADTTNPNRWQHEANVAALGADRVLFGTDAPPLTSPLEQSIAAVTDMSIDDASKQRIFVDNAKDLFGF
jgi:aminocarboxymuconate-semialdehyde decarboxylase